MTSQAKPHIAPTKKFDRELFEKQAKHMPNTSLKLPPNTQKLFISQ